VRPILPGQRGAAVEDVQRKLHLLGHDLGPTGVDGVFLGQTREAVVAFQRAHGLSEDGVVGRETWTALVDATFQLGDRVLYLRLPYFHGQDVRALQEALGALGFAVGQVDGIFGPATGRAVREFQRNSGHIADGIAGAETIQVIERLRHVWEGRSATTHTRPVSEPPPGGLFGRRSVAVAGCDLVAAEVAERVVNVALATDPHARIEIAQDPGAADVTVFLSTLPAIEERTGPCVSGGDDDVAALAARLVTAVETAPEDAGSIAIDLGDVAGEDHEIQRMSVRVFDALRRAMAR